MSVKITGLDELINEVEKMDISTAKQRKALDVGAKILFENIEANAPKLTGYTKKSIKKKITNKNGDVSAIISVNAWDVLFLEFGSSKNRKYVGWFNNSVDDVVEQAINVVSEVIFD